MNIQQHLFEIVKSKISETQDNIAYPERIAEILGISVGAAYRRISGKTAITFKELLILCKRFDISMDEILNFTPEKGIFIQFSDSAVWENNRARCTHYIENLYETLYGLTSSVNGELILAARDIPVYHLVNFPELLFFKFYSEHIQGTAEISYNDFCSQLDKDKIVKTCEQAANIWKQIPSKEIWTDRTINSMLRLLEYNENTCALIEKASILLLLEEILELMDLIKKYANTGNKNNGKIPFSMYLCPVDIKYDSTLIRKGDKLTYNISLFADNGIVVNNVSLCIIAEKWINNLIATSTLISGTSSNERFHFFQTSKDRVKDLISKIKKS
ncbi:MAG: helix-turn-helix domain-containing protein [Prevotellaceae bacterium]|jgi:transcriptional regulator with XRE-family HTH domain|nr:helix-turn-helix domain-containing protein [Prevotellaceae bacterium]